MTGTGSLLDLVYAGAVMLTWATLSVALCLVVCTLADWCATRRTDAARRSLDEIERRRKETTL